MKIRSFRPKNKNIVPVGNYSQPQNPGPVNSTIPARPQGVVSPLPKPTGKAVRLVSLGGVGNVTKNMYVYEYEDDIIIIDCGVSFPEEGMLGVDLVIPDISYLRDKKSKIRGIIVSHGHEDHIGALPYLWQELDVPIYSQKLTCGLIRAKFTEHKLPKDKIHVLNINDHIKLGAFDISFYRVAHSIPDATGVVIDTPIGTLIHQSDFKMDWTPVNGQVTDIAKVAEVSKKGVLFMTVDSLRVERAGFNPSEKPIQQTFERIEKKSQGKILITMTSSNLTRVQQVINVAVESGRKLALVGRSVESTFQVAQDLGYINVPPGLVIAQEEIRRFPDKKMIILIAGSQGQPESALSRVANHAHKYIQLKALDCVVVSADPIPLSMNAQLAMIDNFAKQNIEVYWSVVEPNLHVGGHATKEEIMMMLNLVKPKYVLPIGGSFRHMWAFARMVEELGYDKNQVVLPQDGQVIEISQSGVRMVGHIDLYNVYVDGLSVGDVGSVVLRDRQTMAEEGIVIVLLPINQQTGKIIGAPEIISRGFVFEKSSEDLLDAALEIVKSCLTEQSESGPHDSRYLRHQIEENLDKFFYQEMKRRPMIITIVQDL